MLRASKSGASFESASRISRTMINHRRIRMVGVPADFALNLAYKSKWISDCFEDIYTVSGIEGGRKVYSRARSGNEMDALIPYPGPGAELPGRQALEHECDKT